MRRFRLPSLTRSGLTGLLWLALLMPAAQYAALVHGFSHLVPQTASDRDDRQAPHAQYCDLCLVAADLIGGALPGVPPSVATATPRHEPPATPAASVWLAPTALAYRSQAPPLTQS